MDKGAKFYAERQPFTGDVALHYAQDHGSVLHVAMPVVLRSMEPGERTKPLMVINQTAAQQLMDELWTCGLRPSEGAGSAGQLAATERHLGDMRTLAFAALKVPHG